MLIRVVNGSVDETIYKEIARHLENVEVKGYQEDEMAEIINGEFDLLVLDKELEGDLLERLILDESVEMFSSINAIVRNGNDLVAYNTIGYGFNQALLEYENLITGKNVLLIGDGRYADTFSAVLECYGAESIKRDASLKTIGDKDAFDAIINAANCTDESDVVEYENVKFVFDYRFSPLKSDILISAKLLGKRISNGLYMKMMEAIRAIEISLHMEIEDDRINEIHRNLILAFGNIVFIGMPASGKSSASKNLSIALGIEKYDSDEEIEKSAGMTIKEIFARFGEQHFRSMEMDTIKELSNKKGIILSPGGGAIMREENAVNMMRNGYIIFLNRDIEQIKSNPKNRETRPLLQKEGAVDELFRIRYPLYKLYQDYTIRNNGSKEDTLKRILQHF